MNATGRKEHESTPSLRFTRRRLRLTLRYKVCWLGCLDHEYDQKIPVAIRSLIQKFQPEIHLVSPKIIRLIHLALACDQQ